MSTQLSIIISAHTYLALIAATFFYSFLISVLRRKPASSRTLIFKSSVAFLASLLTYLSGKYLTDYFVGELGFVTDVTVTTFVPTFVYIQQLLLPLMLASGLFILLIIWKKGSAINERPLLYKTVTILGIFGFIAGGALMFLGVLVP